MSADARRDIERRVRAHEMQACAVTSWPPHVIERYVRNALDCITDADVALVDRAMRENPRGYEALMAPRNDAEGLPVHPLFDALREESRVLFEPALARLKARIAMSALAGDGEDYALDDAGRRYAEQAVRMFSEIGGSR